MPVPYEPEAAAANDVCRELNQRLTKLTLFVGIAIVVIVGFAVLITQRVMEDEQRLGDTYDQRRQAMLAARKYGDVLIDLRQRFSPTLHEIVFVRDAARVPTASERATLRGAFLDLKPLRKLQPDERKRRFDVARLTLESLGEPYEVLLDMLDEYEENAGSYVEAVAIQQKVIEDVRQIIDKKESVPSPFGEFDLNPAVALALLAILAAGSYIFVALETRRVLRLTGRAQGTAMTLAPVWIYTTDEYCRQVLGWRRGDYRRRYASAFLIHALWLTVAVGTTVAAFAVDASAKVLFLWPDVIRMILVVANLAALGLFISVFFAGFRTIEKAKSVAAIPVTRRVAAVGLAAGVLGLIGYRQFPRWRHGAPKQPRLLQASQLALPNASLLLIRNEKTGVVHSQIACSTHVPIHSKVVVDGKGWLHRGREVPTLYEAALIAEGEGGRASHPRLGPIAVLGSPRQQGEGNPEVAIAFLQQAIALQPWSYHLHDRLIRTYKRLRRFSAIGELLNASIAQLRERLKSQPANAKAIRKALTELESRRRITLDNAAANARRAQ